MSNNLIIIENDRGRLELKGKRTDTWRIASIEGLGPVEVEEQAVKYVNVPGQKIVEVLPKPRTITIKGSLNTREKNQRQWRLTNAARILDTTKTVTLRGNFSGKLREIECRPISFTTESYNAAGQPFEIILQADNPYFRDWEDATIPLYSRTGNLINGMTFPRVFTYRKTEGLAVNLGDVDVWPVIIIKAGDPGEPAETGILITNETTGKSIQINYGSEDGEEITIDTDARTIISNINGNIINYKDKNSMLGDFKLQQGRNLIKFQNANEGQPLEAFIQYSNMYVEAVY